jgi:hypothetical protein
MPFAAGQTSRSSSRRPRRRRRGPRWQSDDRHITAFGVRRVLHWPTAANVISAKPESLPMLPSRSAKGVVAPRRPLLCGDRLTDASTEVDKHVVARVGRFDRSTIARIKSLRCRRTYARDSVKSLADMTGRQGMAVYTIVPARTMVDRRAVVPSSKLGRRSVRQSDGSRVRNSSRTGDTRGRRHDAPGNTQRKLVPSVPSAVSAVTIRMMGRMD